MSPLTQFYCVPVAPDGTESVKIDSKVDYPHSFDFGSEAYQFCARAKGEALAFMRETGCPKIYLLFNPRTGETCIPKDYPLEERSQIQEQFISFLLRNGVKGGRAAG